MRMLLMISNNNMSLRELYTMVLDSHPTGWVTSFMSGMPADVDAILSGYDAVIYELGAADSPDRVDVVKRMRSGGAQVITHVEGRQAAQRTEELESAGALVVANPLSPTHVSAAIDQLADRLRRPGGNRRRIGFGERLRRMFSG